MPAPTYSNYQNLIDEIIKGVKPRDAGSTRRENIDFINDLNDYLESLQESFSEMNLGLTPHFKEGRENIRAVNKRVEDLRKFIKETDELIDAHIVMEGMPAGTFKSLTQAANYIKEKREINFPEEARLRDYTERFGDDAISLIKDRQDVAYRDAMDEGTYAGKLRRGKVKYGSEDRAIDVMYKNNPLLKQIAKEMPGLTKSFMKSLPYLKSIGVVGGATIAAWKFTEKQQKDFAAEGVSGARAGISPALAIAANTALEATGGSAKSLSGIGQWKKNIGDLMLGGSSDFLKTFAMRGIDVYGSGAAGFATGEEFFTRVTKRIKELRASGQEEKALDLAEKAGIDASIWKEIELSKDGDVLSYINAVGKDTNAERAARQEDRTIRRSRTIDKSLRSLKEKWATGSQTFFGASIRDLIDSVLFPTSNAEEAKDIANETSAHSPSASHSIDGATASASNQFSINIGTLDVNAENPEQLAYELGTAASSHSNNHTLAVAFDLGLKA